ncbi:cytochrome c oxidase subunit II [Bosea sp. Tri-44]|uniref:cytochrome c oxidase subunit II n=1 Tax=Bosea sp. Tri-44 TaxID=1972137 RepID=UPI00100DEDEC|nr:cytochrome c oxidase subunit II [Bosea sp. Tri-44]RXT54389.1 cytochrome c oxidase subunit II [Bosea sp. Tri-44]
MRQGAAISAVIVGLAGVSACSPQSALAPAGDEAEKIALLSWILFAGGATILSLVLAVLGGAIWGPARIRRVLSGDGLIRWGGIVFPVITLSILLGYGLWLMRETIAAPTPPELRIDVTGEQWWWRIIYHREGAAPVSEANEIRIPVGRDIEFTLRSNDVIHSFWVPSLGGKLDMIPGRTNRLRLKADRPGIYRGQCAEYCGGPHALMALEIVAVPQAEFDAWLAAADQRGRPAEGRLVRGEQLFLSAGCGACHAVRGTQAAGVIGPDLSRVGGRRFLGAATVPHTPENLAGFIINPQTVKPGALMPPFAIFSAEEISALTSYLGSLR